MLAVAIVSVLGAAWLALEAPLGDAAITQSASEPALAPSTGTALATKESS